MAELYFGFAVNSGTATGGTTPGFTYSTDPAGDGIAWNADVTAATAPSWGDFGQQLGLMMLLYETSAPSPSAAVSRPMASRAVTIPIRAGRR